MKKNGCNCVFQIFVVPCFFTSICWRLVENWFHRTNVVLTNGFISDLFLFFTLFFICLLYRHEHKIEKIRIVNLSTGGIQPVAIPYWHFQYVPHNHVNHHIEMVPDLHQNSISFVINWHIVWPKIALWSSSQISAMFVICFSMQSPRFNWCLSFVLKMVWPKAHA